MEEGREGSGLGRGRPQAVTPHTRPLRLLPPTAASRQSCPGVSGVGAQVQRPSSPVRRWNTLETEALEPGCPRAGPGSSLLRQSRQGCPSGQGPDVRTGLEKVEKGSRLRAGGAQQASRAAGTISTKIRGSQGCLSSLIIEPHLHGSLAGRNKHHRSHWFSH